MFCLPPRGVRVLSFPPFLLVPARQNAICRSPLYIPRLPFPHLIIGRTGGDKTPPLSPLLPIHSPIAGVSLRLVAGGRRGEIIQSVTDQSSLRATR